MGKGEIAKENSKNGICLLFGRKTLLEKKTRAPHEGAKAGLQLLFILNVWSLVMFLLKKMDFFYITFSCHFKRIRIPKMGIILAKMN